MLPDPVSDAPSLDSPLPSRVSTPPVSERPLDWTFALEDFVNSVSWSPDGKHVAAAGSGGPIVLLDGSTGTKQETWAGHDGGTFRAVFSPVENRVASVGQDGHVRIWMPLSKGTPVGIPVAKSWVEQLAWAPDGSALAVAAGRDVRILRPDGSIAHSPAPLPSTISSLAWRADARELAAAAYGRIQIWDAGSGVAQAPILWNTSLISLSWSPDRRWIAAGTQEQSIQIWEMPARPGEELAMSGYAAKVRNLAWHRSGRYLATDGGHEIMVWDCIGRGPAGTHPRILTGHDQRVTALAYQRDGHLLASGSEDGRVLLWNVGKSTSPLRQFRLPGGVSCLDWSRDDAILAIGCQNGTVAAVRITD